MKQINEKFWGVSKLWWIVLCVGILMILGGFAYWFWPVQGFAVASILFGWLLVLAGFVQLLVSAGPNRPSGWGWWLIGGVLDLFIGFMLVRSVVLSEAVFPYFIALIFVYWGVSAIFSSVSQRARQYWWLYLINGILMLVVGFFFIEAGYLQQMEMTSFLVSLAFIYWGISLAMLSYDMRPGRQIEE